MHISNDHPAPVWTYVRRACCWCVERRTCRHASVVWKFSVASAAVAVQALRQQIAELDMGTQLARRTTNKMISTTISTTMQQLDHRSVVVSICNESSFLHHLPSFLRMTYVSFFMLFCSLPPTRCIVSSTLSSISACSSSSRPIVSA